MAIPHEDHVDYAHDGHLHRDHQDHVDECEPDGRREHPGHDHAHGEACGHAAVPHQDHVDYVHDGHDGHWDDH
ncbi:hypothetical protein M4914_20130 [Streptomyces somaliensis DSM 40738]|nr:hypothetical protein [Streptomyces somaliensis]MCQ0025016.1 hypothetical protein [Streptomyces somaliensis DSM 40738]